MKHSLLFHSILLAALSAAGGHLSFAQFGWLWQNPLPQGNNLRGVSFTDANTGTAVGEAGTILRTTNGGASWTSQPSGTTTWLCGISFTNADTGWVVGWNGTILRTTNGGVTAVEEDVSAAIPAGFCLKQNYPNPFNPSTTIGYQSTTQSHVTLKVFDMLGREVATLVNGLQQAGNRLVEFRAEHLPGGVYFYRLEGGGFVNVKKLILLK